MPATLTAKKTKKKTSLPKTSFLWVQLNLPLRHAEIDLFRSAFLACLNSAADKKLVSHEEKDEAGNTAYESCYPLVQFRCHRQHAAIFALQQGVPLVEKFIQQYCKKKSPKGKSFRWKGSLFPLQVAGREKENGFAVSICPLPSHIYRLHSWLPFSKKNYEQWWKPNRDEPDIKKTGKLQELLINHICTFVHAAGGNIPKQKIKLVILDKDRLKKIFFKNQGQVAFDIRYAVNLQLPPFLGLGNHTAFGFGWQQPEY